MPSLKLDVKPIESHPTIINPDSLETIQENSAMLTLQKGGELFDYNAIAARKMKAQREFEFWFGVAALSALGLIIWVAVM